MRILFSVCCFIGGCLYAGTASSSYLYLSDSQSFKNFQVQIADAMSTSPKFDTMLRLNSVSVPLSLQAENSPLGAPVKLASVNFVTDPGNGISPTPAAQTINCSGYPYRYEMAFTNCATHSYCGKGSNLRFKCTSCKGNMTLGTDGRCRCNQSVYKYSLYGGVTGGASCAYGFDTTNGGMCQEMDHDGSLHTYYSSCACPSGWSTCNGTGQVGSGESCVNAGGQTLYVGCTCRSPYTYTCEGTNEGPSGAYCQNTITGKRYYAGCGEVCSDGTYKSAADWWSKEVYPGCTQADGCSSSSNGDFVYTDGTCSSSLQSGKTPMGIVIDSTNRIAISIYIDSSIWINGSAYDEVAGTQNLNSALLAWHNGITKTNKSAALNDMNGISNTNTILAQNPTQSAAQVCRAKGTNWFLPSAGQLNRALTYRNKINQVGGDTMDLDYSGEGIELSSTVVGPSSINLSIIAVWAMDDTIYEDIGGEMYSIPNLVEWPADTTYPVDVRCAFTY